MTTTPRRLALLFALLVPIAACSSGGSDGTAPDTTEAANDGGSAAEDAATDDAPAGGAGATDDPLDIPDDIPLEAVVSGIEVAMEPEEVEIDGSTLHVYLAEDNAKVPAGTECIILESVLPDGATAVVHRDGTETTC